MAAIRRFHENFRQATETTHAIFCNHHKDFSHAY